MNLKEQELEEAKKHLEEAVAFSKAGEYEKAMEYLEHIVKVFKKYECWELYIQCLGKWCESLFKSGNSEKAFEIGEYALSVSQEKLGEHVQETAYCYNILGIIYRHSGDFEKSIFYFKKGLVIKIKIFGKEHYSVATIYNNLIVLYDDIGEYNEAIKCGIKCIEIFEKNHPKLAKAYLNLGVAYRQKGNYTKAIQCFQHSLSIEITSLCYNNLGIVYGAKKDNDKAISYFKKSLHLTLNSYGELNPYAANHYMNIGIAYMQKGLHDQSIEYLNKSLEIRIKIFGKKHPSISNTYHSLGNTYLAQKNWLKAVTFHRKALDINLKTLGPLHPNTARTLSAVGSVYAEIGIFQKARNYYKKSLRVQSSALGKSHIDVVVSYFFMGNIFLKNKQYVSALVYYQKAIGALFHTPISSNIYVNPLFQNCLSYNHLLDVLQSKAYTLQQFYIPTNKTPKNLLAALFTYHLTTQIITYLRQSYQFEGSQLNLAQKSIKVYEEAISVGLAITEAMEVKEEAFKLACNELQKLNPDYSIPNPENAKSLAFTYAEQAKSMVLYLGMQEATAKTVAQIPKELLDREYDLRVELNYLDRCINQERYKNEKADATRLLQLQSQHFDYKQQYEALILQFEKEYPEYFQLKYNTSTASVAHVQAHLQCQTTPTAL